MWATLPFLLSMVNTLSDELAGMPNHVIVFMKSHVKCGAMATFGKLPNREPKIISTCCGIKLVAEHLSE
jgi:hypothetical protein